MTTSKSTEHCPIACAAQLIGDTWVMLILRDLLPGAQRFGDLQSSVVSYHTGARINSKTLTDRLKLLEEQEIITRTAFEHEKPPRVEYALTAKGRDLSSIIDQLRVFGEKYM